MDKIQVKWWIDAQKQLPPNAKHPHSFCPRYLVHTTFGTSEGWYRGDQKGWYVLLWFKDGPYEKWNIDLEGGDVPKVAFIPDGDNNVKVDAWMPLPEPPRGGIVESEAQDETD